MHDRPSKRQQGEQQDSQWADEHTIIPHFGFSRDQERQGLGRVIRELFAWPIDNRRWRAIRPEVLAVLREKAGAYGTTVALELERAERAAFTTVLPTMGQVVLRGGNYDEQSFAQWARELRRKVNRQLTEDLLGPDWRKPRQHVKEALPQVSSGPEQDLAIETRNMLLNEKLSAAEREAFQAFLDCDGDHAAAAQQLGLSADAFDQRFSRARRKLREDRRAG